MEVSTLWQELSTARPHKDLNPGIASTDHVSEDYKYTYDCKHCKHPKDRCILAESHGMTIKVCQLCGTIISDPDV